MGYDQSIRVDRYLLPVNYQFPLDSENQNSLTLNYLNGAKLVLLEAKKAIGHKWLAALRVGTVCPKSSTENDG